MLPHARRQLQGERRQELGRQQRLAAGPRRPAQPARGPRGRHRPWERRRHHPAGQRHLRDRLPVDIAAERLARFFAASVELTIAEISEALAIQAVGWSDVDALPAKEQSDFTVFSHAVVQPAQTAMQVRFFDAGGGLLQNVVLPGHLSYWPDRRETCHFRILAAKPGN